MTALVRARNLTLLALAAAVSMLLALRVGAAHGALITAWRDPASLDRAILEARGARVLLGALAGGALAVASRRGALWVRARVAGRPW